MTMPINQDGVATFNVCAHCTLEFNSDSHNAVYKQGLAFCCQACVEYYEEEIEKDIKSNRKEVPNTGAFRKNGF